MANTAVQTQSSPRKVGMEFGSPIPWADPSNFYLPSPFYDESHLAVRKLARAWIDEHVTPNVNDWEEEGEVDLSKYKEAAKAGMLVPFAFGARIDPKWVDEKDDRGIIAGIPPAKWNGKSCLRSSNAPSNSPGSFTGFHDYVLIDELMRCGGAGPRKRIFWNTGASNRNNIP